MKIAIIGTGAAGLSAAFALSKHHDVTVFEAANRPGGHAHTVDLPASPETAPTSVPVDTGFIVYNEHNYPNFIQMMKTLNVATEESDMSFSVSIGTGPTRGACEYLGEPLGLFAQKRNILKPSHWMMIRDLISFYKTAPELLSFARTDNLTLGELLESKNYSQAFVYRHLLPMAAAIWSTPVDQVRDFPAETFINFFANHRLFELDIKKRPIWRTVSGGSRTYVHKIIEALGSRVNLATPVKNLTRDAQGITVTLENKGEVLFDQVVFACHPDQALTIIGADARPGERSVLGAITYTQNTGVLHQDLRLMPKRRAAWSSWNYLAAKEAAPEEDMSPVALSYWMNKLQNLQTQEPVILTLNPLFEPAPEKTYGTYTYDHPLFDKSALDAQHKLPLIQGIDRLWFCGAWAGYGFHEDAMSSGLAVAKALGAAMPWQDSISEMSPASTNATPAPQSTTMAAE